VSSVYIGLLLTVEPILEPNGAVVLGARTTPGGGETPTAPGLAASGSHYEFST